MAIHSKETHVMPSILQSLKAVTANRPRHLSPVAVRRNKLIARIDQQIKVAHSKSRGEQHVVTSNYRKRNKLTGEMIDTVHQRTIKECWWVNDDGKLLIELRYGVRTIEFAKGRSAIEVGSWDQLIPTFELLKKATDAGEFDEQLSAVASRLERQLKAKRG
jgi:hypothetical protein